MATETQRRGEEKALPKEVQKHYDDLLAEDARMPEMVFAEETRRILAWGRWARALKGQEIADAVMAINAHCVSPDTQLHYLLLEAYQRLKKTKAR